MMRRVSGLASATLCLLLTACGATTSSPTTPFNPGGPGGFGGYCAGGTIIPAQGARPELCRTDTNLSAWFFWSFYLASQPPRLTPSNPLSQAAAVQPFVALQPGDVITWQATGRWDKWNSSGCDNYRDLDGYIGANLAVNEGMPQGMLATDGTETTLLGSASVWQIQNSGFLYMGFNMSTWSTSCWEVYPTVFKHSRCTSASGVAQACPF